MACVLRVRHAPRVLAGAAAASVAVGAALLALSAGSSPASGTGGPGAARAALTRVLQSWHLGPGVRAPGPQATTNGLTQVRYYNWAGYADSSGKYNQVAGSWTEPALACVAHEDELAVFWVGLDGFNTRTVEQDGTLAQCSNGTAAYYSWWEMYPTNRIQVVGDTVRPGDKITGSVTVAKGAYTLTLTDSTHPANSFVRHETCASKLTCADASAEWIAETPGTSRGYAPLPDFARWSLTGASATNTAGKQGTISAFPDNEISLIGNRNDNLAVPTALTSSGSSFADAWKYIW